VYVIEGIRDRALNASEKTVKLYIRDYFSIAKAFVYRVTVLNYCNKFFLGSLLSMIIIINI
jgi:hypothetical protein